MIKSTCLIALLLIVLCWSVVRAQDRIMDILTTKIIQKYQQSSCEQLSKQKSEPKSAQEQQVIQMLRNDPQLRTAFINKVAAPIANKLFECGMIP